MDVQILRSEPGKLESGLRQVELLSRPFRVLGRLAFRASAPRALLEALVATALLTLLFLQLDIEVPLPARTYRFGPSPATAGMLAALLCAFRMSFPADSWWSRSGRRRFLVEIGSVILFPLTGAAIFWLLLADQMTPSYNRSIVPRLLVSATPVFLFARLWFYLWRWWDQLRRRHLRWALTHALLVIIALGALLVGLYSFVRDALIQGSADVIYFGDETGWYSIPVPPLIRAFENVHEILNQGIFMWPMPVVLIGLPLALFSYIIARQLTRRLELLVTATSSLRAGDYRVRVDVAGEDEVAQLEADFNAMAAELQRVVQALQEERDKSERLLLNILPESIARRLKDEQRAIADGFADVTVLFADIVDFTRTSSGLPPKEVVAWLNELFSTFDTLAEQHGLEKIKTIGDAYMAVAGLPNARPDHVRAVAEMALAMQEVVTTRAAPNGERLRLRIGINTGQVVAGVIGTKKFLYDLWGDTVNTASRMEANGLSGAIQVTEATYERLKDSYEFEQRGPIPIKGKGEMLTYLLRGRKAQSRGDGSAQTDERLGGSSCNLG